MSPVSWEPYIVPLQRISKNGLMKTKTMPQDLEKFTQVKLLDGIISAMKKKTKVRTPVKISPTTVAPTYLRNSFITGSYFDSTEPVIQALAQYVAKIRKKVGTAKHKS